MKRASREVGSVLGDAEDLPSVLRRLEGTHVWPMLTSHQPQCETRAKRQARDSSVLQKFAVSTSLLGLTIKRKILLEPSRNSKDIKHISTKGNVGHLLAPTAL